MKIAIVTTSFPRWQHDYVGAFIYEAARAIQRQGCLVKVITIHTPGTPRHENWDGIEIYRTRYLPDRWELLKSEGGGIPEVWKKNPGARLQLVPFIIAFLIDVIIHTRDCDILHANWTLSGIIAWMAHILSNKPYVVTIHGSDIYRTQNWPIIIDLTRIALRRAKKVVVVSQALASVIHSIGIPLLKISVIPDGVDTAYFTPLPYEVRSNSILYVGSLIERKGIKYLIQAFSSVINHYIDYKLIIVGEGPQRQEYEELARSVVSPTQVIFTGALSQKQVAEAMQQAKLFVLPSIEEGLGVVLLEALASGTPIVASQVGGISDVVDSQLGILVPPRESDALAKAIIAILGLSEGDRKEMHENARKQAVERYDWAIIARRIIELYTN